MQEANTSIKPKVLRDIINNVMLEVNKVNYDILYKLYIPHGSDKTTALSLGA